MYNGVDSGQHFKKTMAGTKEVLQTFMLDHNFTRTCMERPPATGEEQGHNSADDHSNSSVSGKSEVSNATPRRADADLGYEPEGSASALPHERWKISLHNMLEDRDGVYLFNQYLKEIKENKILDCWLAMKGFQDFGLKTYRSASSSAASSTTGPICDPQIQMDEETINKRNRLAAKIYHDYLDDSRGDKHVRSVVKTATKVYIRQHIKTAKKNRHRLDRDLFLQAQNEIERNVECYSYRDFLNSKLFLQHATQYDGVSITKVVQAPYIAQPAPDPKNVKPPALESPSNQMASRLSRIPEERVWIPEDPQGKAGNINPNKSRANPSNTTGSKNYSGSSGIQRTSTAAYPYYVVPGYQNPAPSAVGSDQASKSSDTTDFTDSSVDGVPPVSKTSSRKELKYARCHLQKPDVLPPCPHKPRTKTCGKIPTMATDDPASFFELLRGKLEKLAASLERQKRESEKFVVVPDEDSNQILESHLSRVVLESPRGEHSPPNVGINTTRRVRHFAPQPSGIPTNVMYSGFDPKLSTTASDVLADGSPLTGLSGSFQRNSSHRSFDVPMTSVSSRKDTLPRNKQRSSDVASINMGIVPGIPNNSVPDVPTPVIPVDKTQMISAWIQTPNDHSRTRKSAKSRQASDTFDVDPVPSFVNPVSSTGLIASHYKPKYSPLRPQPAGLLAQDPTMPLLDQPDAGTTIEEVKRRLIEETEVHESAAMSDFYKHMSSAPSLETSSKIPPSSAMITSEDVNRSADETDTDSSTQTCPSNKQPMSLEPSNTKTTVIYRLPNEKYPYKVHLSSDYPITLGQLKNYLVPLHKGQKYRYFFKKRSNSSSEFFEEYCNDNDQLPIYDGTTVRAKLEHITGDGYH